MNISTDNINKPSPVLFKKIKRAISLTVTFGCGIMFALGYTDESLTMLIIKLSESFLMNLVDLLAADDITT